jgi:hypothetical protein
VTPPSSVSCTEEALARKKTVRRCDGTADAGFNASFRFPVVPAWWYALRTRTNTTVPGTVGRSYILVLRIEFEKTAKIRETIPSGSESTTSTSLLLVLVRTTMGFIP